eukprot:CAMPEP_0197505494 /NCGR_PEP_ID=MMETSP1312-20131121/4232_1 /TAXON_ID=464262 /ORGANISM="Genus nov. species nov., Strain RCC2335" /LENGTH=96 /DNA_ID=CAMNT_0043052447 /DNA_START=48 /DNA_END=339 /DNA_ORIENTATION=+
MKQSVRRAVLAAAQTLCGPVDEVKANKDGKEIPSSAAYLDLLSVQANLARDGAAGLPPLIISGHFLSGPACYSVKAMHDPWEHRGHPRAILRQALT